MTQQSFDLSQRNLYLCTEIIPNITHFADEVLRGGVDILQLRDKNADAKEIIRCARELRKITRDHGVPFVINDRPDIALEVDADGVHVGQDDVSARLVRKIAPNILVGLSTHSIPELKASEDEPVDYISAGPISETPTKPGRMGTGPDYVQLAASTSPKPVFATGGIEPSVIEPLFVRGITHFVVVRFLTQASDPFRNAKVLRDAIDRCKEL